MGPWTTGTYAPFSSAIAAGKIMGLSKQQLANAFGLAFTECSSTRQPHREGVLAIRIHQGLSVKAGVVSALLAKEGITGPLESLEGEFGLYNVFFGGNYDRKTIYKDLGGSFEIENVSIKPYPCCAMTHRSIEAALQIKSENNLSPDEIDKIIVYVNTDSLVTVGQPLEQKQTPKSIIDAQFSIPYTVACALVYNKVDMSMFTLDAIRDEKVINISKKLEVKSDPVFDAALDTVSSTQFRLYT
ncbi:MmgE/PrpD family protein, partial [Aeromonas veronii]|nr:MmgE/PrpD family protein [Aeromonas veronii]